MEQLRAFARRHLLEHAHARVEFELQKIGGALDPPAGNETRARTPGAPGSGRLR
jgi:hypothetical protein